MAEKHEFEVKREATIPASRSTVYGCSPTSTGGASGRRGKTSTPT